MSCIVYQVDKKTGVKYAYESVSYWDKDKQQPRSKRVYLGRVDPETGEIIPKKRKMVHSEETEEKNNPDFETLYNELQNKDEVIAQLQGEVRELREKLDKAVEAMDKIRAIVEEGI